MKELKFRAWDKEKNEYDEYGPFDLLHGSSGYFGDCICGYPERYVLEQFTGLRDRNGVEIYVGDILRHDLWGSAPVVWDEMRAGFACQRDGETTNDIFDVGLGHMQLKRSKVVGNLHQNPELLTPNPS